jgi:hypothetical protein
LSGFSAINIYSALTMPTALCNNAQRVIRQALP